MAGKVGFIGLGVMGLPMARNLLGAGFDVVAHNRSRGPVDEIAQAGAGRGGSAAGVAAASDVTILMLPDDDAVEQVVRPAGRRLRRARRPGTDAPLAPEALDEQARGRRRRQAECRER